MLRITLDQRGKLFFWSLTERGEQHESFRGYTTLLESCRDLYRRLLGLAKWREQEKQKRPAERQ